MSNFNLIQLFHLFHNLQDLIIHPIKHTINPLIALLIIVLLLIVLLPVPFLLLLIVPLLLLLPMLLIVPLLVKVVLLPKPPSSLRLIIVLLLPLDRHFLVVMPQHQTQFIHRLN